MTSRFEIECRHCCRNYPNVNKKERNEMKIVIYLCRDRNRKVGRVRRRVLFGRPRKNLRPMNCVKRKWKLLRGIQFRNLGEAKQYQDKYKKKGQRQ
jgi:hypothetical protein